MSFISNIQLFSRMGFFLLILFIAATSAKIQDDRVKLFKWRGPPVMDETVFTNPNSFDYDFEEDLNKEADINDIYDEGVKRLPSFHLFIKGEDHGYTKVPIVTRKGQTWSTQADDREPKNYRYTTPMSVLPDVQENFAVEKVASFESQPKKIRTTTTITTTTATTTTSPLTTTFATSTFRPVTSQFRSSFAATTPEAPVTVFRERLPGVWAQQPAPAFKAPLPSNSAPIWRRGGQVIFNRPSTTSRPFTSQSFSSFRMRTQSPQKSAPEFNKFHSAPQDVSNAINTVRRPFVASRPQITDRPVVSNSVSRFSASNGRPFVQHRGSQRRVQPKPVIIQRGNEPHRGPTYNCRVLNPFVDGSPSPAHDPTCKMLYPGFSLDGQCRCLYTVAGRDENGCAVGFLFACRRVFP